MSKNGNLHKARDAKNDEFYTSFEDVNAEMNYYRNQFQGKSVYLNCDSKKSNFWLYFRIRFDFLGLRELVATHYDEHGGAYKLTYTGGLGVYHPDQGDEGLWTTKEPLDGNGDFRSPECLDLLAQCDVVVTNPPFSLFRDYVEVVDSFDKEFLIIGSMNAITYQGVFKLIKNNKLWLGVNTVKRFLQPDGSFKHFGNICWFTNLNHYKRNEELLLFKKYDPSLYPRYDNYDAIEVSKVVNIPEDFDGIMGVPITFLTKYNPDQFEIIGVMATTQVTEENHGYPFVDGKKKYARILIKRKQD